MRNNIVHAGADNLKYEIRGIVSVAQKFQQEGLKIYWENIGDPVAKGEVTPNWIRDIVATTVQTEPKSFAYSPTKGVLATREYIAQKRNARGGVNITPEDILFFNGLGDAISKIYSNLDEHVRVIGPDPAYPTHSSAEAAHAGSPHLTYKLDPKNNWLPNLADLRRQVEENPAISGIIIINPDNPTGVVYPREILEGIVAIAKEFGLFMISDEIYSNLVFDGEMIELGDIIGEVPGMALRGLSKEVPWPGARCGWVEFYNTDKDQNFARYVQSLVDSKMLEVCSTTLPQMVLPKIQSDARYEPHLQDSRKKYKARADITSTFLSGIPEIYFNKPKAAFYLTVVFKDGILNTTQTLPISNQATKQHVETLILSQPDMPLDKRFVYYLLGSTGICVVPLSGFNSNLVGFRITLLEQDTATFEHIFKTLAQAITQYCKSN
jgi:aspartate/methionine/tyrosine aminotransferase